MRPTRTPTLIAVAVAAGVILWIITRMAYAVLPALPWTTVATLLVVAIIELLLARNVWLRVRRGRGAPPIEPLRVARYAVLAKASAYAAALVAGAFGGILADLLAEPLASPTERADAWVAGASLFAACGLAVAALLLEHACKVPKPPKERERTVDRRSPDV